MRTAVNVEKGLQQVKGQQERIKNSIYLFNKGGKVLMGIRWIIK